jgi:hypothetical protein
MTETKGGDMRVRLSTRAIAAAYVLFLAIPLVGVTGL